jgi:hypothetical protein
LIHLGSVEENPVYLCRYQDASYIDRKPAGWPVLIEKPGQYEVSINRGEPKGDEELVIQLDSTLSILALNDAENRAVVSLPAGKAIFNAWVREKGKEYVPRHEEDLIGDVIVRFIQP